MKKRKNFFVNLGEKDVGVGKYDIIKPDGRRYVLKRIVLLLLMLFFALSLFSCGKQSGDESDQNSSETLKAEANMLNPLFRIAAIEGQSKPETKYLATEKGFFYLSKTQEGYAGGFFELPNTISNEAIFKCKSGDVPAFDLGENTAVAFADRKLHFLTLDAGSGTSYELGDKLQFSDILLGGDGALYYETEEYLLTADLSFSEDYSSLEITEKIVMLKEKINGFTQMLGVSEDGERMYYAYNQDGKTGYAYFGIGYRAEELDKTELSYDAVTRISGTKVLFCKKESGKQTYTYVDLDTGDKKEFSVGASTIYKSFAVNSGGTYFVGYLPTENSETGGYLDLWSLDQAKRVKRYELADLLINPSLAFSPEGKYIVVGQYDTGEAYGDAGGETVTSIEVSV